MSCYVYLLRRMLPSISLALTFSRWSLSVFFFFNDTATTEIYTLSLHDALPISSELRHTGYQECPPFEWSSAEACNASVTVMSASSHCTSPRGTMIDVSERSSR